MSRSLILKMNRCYDGVSREPKKFTFEGGNGSHTPFLKR
jgi:hypothetical protein